MKKFFYTLIGFLGVALFVGCSEKTTYPTPVALDPSLITYQALPGAVKLQWEIPANANYKFVKVTYTIPDSDGQMKECMRMASIYSDTMLVDNLLARYGEIAFTFQTCSPDGNGGETFTLNAQALPAEKIIQSTSKDFLISTFWADNPESTEGPLADLFDGNNSTFYHMSWSSPSPWPHYIVVDLGQEISFFSFSYTCRDHNNKDNPSAIDILVSQDMPASGPNYATEDGTTKIASLTDLPSDKGASYTSEVIESPQPFRYVWMKVLGATSGKNFVALSEMSFKQIERTIYDPETGETTVL